MGNVQHGFLLSGGAFTTIDGPGSVETFAAGINASGQIVGGYFDNDGFGHGFLLSGGVFTTIDPPGLSFETDAYVLDARRCFLADEQGLGKTVEALAALEADDAYPAVVVCTYNVEQLPGSVLIFAGIETHPLTILGTTLCENPHYVPFAEYIQRRGRPTKAERERNLGGVRIAPLR